MEIIKKRIVKYFIYNRKQSNRAISLEEVSKDTKSINEIITNIFDRINFNELSRVIKIADRESKRVILSIKDIKVTLSTMLRDLIKNYELTSQDTAIYRGEHLSLILSVNRNGEHIITLLPCIDIL